MLPSLLWVALVLAGGIQANAVVPGSLSERVVCPSDPTQTYTLYLPSKYERSRQWPLLLVFDPRGHGTAAAEVFREAAEAFGWIVISSDNTRSDGPWEPNRRALAALWPYALSAHAVDPRRVYAAGFSGGATVAWVLARSGAPLAGIIATGAPAPRDPDATPGRLAWFGAAGRADFNFLDARELDGRMARAGVPHRLEFFDGVHQWMTPEVGRLAIAWLEMLAMRDHLRPRDDALTAAIVADELARVERLIAAGRIVDARRSLGSIVGGYGDVADVSEAMKQMRTLDADARLARAAKEEQRGDERERAQLAAARTALARLRADEPPYPRELVEVLNIPSLQKDAREARYEGEAARRVLESIFVQTAMYIPQQLEEEREFARAAVSLEVATAIHPDRPLLWVNLAGARAMSGSRKSALAALTRAVEAGFRNADGLAKDEQFASLRGTPEYARLVEKMVAK